MPSVRASSLSQPRAGFLPPRVSGSRMFSRAVRVGMRLKAWNTKPMRSRRSSVMPLSSSVPRSTSPSSTWPEVSRSSPARQCSVVDFPEPDGPMTAVNCPAPKSAETPSRARTAVTPAP